MKWDEKKLIHIMNQEFGTNKKYRKKHQTYLKYQSLVFQIAVFAQIMFSNQRCMDSPMRD